MGRRLKDLARRALPAPVYHFLRRRRLSSMVRAYEPWVRTGRFGGHDLRVRIADPLAEGWYGQDWISMPEIDLLQELGVLGPGTRVFDLGAHQGVVALVLAREVGEGGSVLALEANSHNAAVAMENARLNGITQMTVMHAAVAAEDGPVAFDGELNGSLTDVRYGTEVVDGHTVDSLARRFGHPGLVFMDIEGHECGALQAASETLQAGAAFFVEVHVEMLSGCSADSILERFNGRRVYIAEDGGPFTLHAGGTAPTSRFFLVAA